MTRIVFWSIWLSSGLLILILLGGIVKIMVKPSDSTMESQSRFDADGTIFSTSQSSVVVENAQQLNKILDGRRVYSNPDPTSEDEDDPQYAVIKKPKRTLKPIGAFNLNQSFTYKDSNGKLAFVLPSQTVLSTTVSTSNTFGDKSNPTTVTDRKGFGKLSDHEYPADLIDGIMEKHKTSFAGAFGNDLINGDILNSRSDISADDVFCEINERLIHPIKGLTVKNSSVWIVNTKTHQQGVRIETCRNEGKSCKFCDENTKCKQLYHYRTLVTVNPDDSEKNPLKQPILLPSCCKCIRIQFTTAAEMIDLR